MIKMRTIQTIIIFLVSLMVVEGTELIKDYYTVTGKCPEAEQIVKEVAWSRVQQEPGTGADLLRLHFHDCIVSGCDGSVLLDSTETNQAEKDAQPNLTLDGFDVIDEIKTRIESVCPQTVSCADILALAARDAVSFPFNRSLWEVRTGRKDNTVSLLSDVEGNLPSEFSDFTTLLTMFQNKNLTLVDLVALSGAHTIGVAHCAAFTPRLNFTGNGDTDPSLDPDYADFLRTVCPNPPNPNTVLGMDPNSSLTFDTHYYTALKQHQGLFESDAALLTDRTAAKLVTKFENQHAFFRQFAKSMLKMGALSPPVEDVLEIRQNCHVVNPLIESQ